MNAHGVVEIASILGEPQMPLGDPLASKGRRQEKLPSVVYSLTFLHSLESFLKDSNWSLQLGHTWLCRLPLTAFTLHLFWQKGCACSVPE